MASALASYRRIYQSTERHATPGFGGCRRRGPIERSLAFVSGLAWAHLHRGLAAGELGALSTPTLKAFLEHGEARALSGGIPITRLEELPAHRRPPTAYGTGRHPELFELGHTLDHHSARLSLLPCGAPRRAAAPSRGRDHAKEGEDGLYPCAATDAWAAATEEAPTVPQCSYDGIA